MGEFKVINNYPRCRDFFSGALRCVCVSVRREKSSRVSQY